MQRTGSLQFSYIFQERETFSHVRNERSRGDYEARQIIQPCGAGQPVRRINLAFTIDLVHELGQLAPGVLLFLSTKTGIKLAFAKTRIYSCYKPDSKYNLDSENYY